MNIDLAVFAVAVLASKHSPRVDVRCADDRHRLGRVDAHPDYGWVLSVPGYRITLRDYEGRTDRYRHPPTADEVGVEAVCGYILADIGDGSTVASRCRHGMHAISARACLRAIEEGERRVLANRSFARTDRHT